MTLYENPILYEGLSVKDNTIYTIHPPHPTVPEAMVSRGPAS